MSDKKKKRLSKYLVFGAGIAFLVCSIVAISININQKQSRPNTDSANIYIDEEETEKTSPENEPSNELSDQDDYNEYNEYNEYQTNKSDNGRTNHTEQNASIPEQSAETTAISDQPAQDQQEELLDCSGIAATLYDMVVDKMTSYYRGLDEDAQSYAEKKAETAGGGAGWVNAYKEEYKQMHSAETQTWMNNLVQSAYIVASDNGCGDEFLSYGL